MCNLRRHGPTERAQLQAEIGPAVNLFVPNMPRLLMDIGFTLCTRPREDALKAIRDELVAPGSSTLIHV